MVKAVIGITIEYKLHQKVTERLRDDRKALSTLISELLEKWLIQEVNNGTKTRQK